MKRLIFPLLLLTIIFPAFSRGVMSGERDLRVIKTEWFDIIFPARSEPQAQRLAAQADSIYREIAQDYGMEPQFRMPVVITPAVEQHNAYFSQAFYNHIVLYDSQPSVSLDFFSDNLLSVFAHELTHAYTYNMKNGFWKGVGTVFGDTVNPGHLLLTRGWAEGSTLTMESSRGEGRMNSGYSLQMVRQAAIEDKFPAYADVQGARDSYPVGSFYNFNGGFNQWLQDTYGMEKYAQFWYSCINLKALTAGQAFKKVYGLSLKVAWAEFKKQIESQWGHLEANPLQATETDGFPLSDFFAPSSADFSMDNRAGSLYTSLVSSSRRLAWIDSASSTIFYWDFPTGRVSKNPGTEAAKNTPPQVKRLATIQGIQGIQLSDDGRFLVASILSQGFSTPKLQVKLYDMEEGRWYSLAVSGRSSPTVVTTSRLPLNSDDSNSTANGSPPQPGGYLLVSAEYQQGGNRLHIERLLLQDKTLVLEPLCTSPLQERTFYRDFLKMEGERLAFIKSQEGRQSIVLLNFESLPHGEFWNWPQDSKAFQEISFSQLEHEGKPLDKIEVRNLSQGKNPWTGSPGLLFSWAAKDTLPRLGYWDGTTGEIFLQSKDISGGVHYPVSIGTLQASAHQTGDGPFSEGIAFAGNFYEENRLLRGSLSDLSLQAATRMDSLPAENPQILWNGTADYLPSKKYRPLAYYTQGVFLPLALNLSMPYYGNPQRESMSLPVGASWMTSNPWLMGVTIASFGYGIDSKSVAYNISYQNGTDTNLFQYSLSQNSEFDVTGKGWLQSTLTGSMGTTLPAGRLSRFTLANTTRTQFGQIILDGNKSASTSSLENSASQKEGFYFHLINSASASWSNVHQWGPGLHEKLGLSLGAEIYYTMNTSLSTRNLNMSAGNIGIAAKLFIPKLIPIRTILNHTYNLPSTISLSLFPSGLSSDGGTSILSYTWGQTPKPAASMEAKTILYSINIQKALPAVTALYINDFTVSLRGMVGFEDRFSLSDKDLASGNVVIPPGDDSWRLFSLDQYFSRLGSHQVPVVANIALRADLGVSPNIGFSAYPAFGSNLYLELTTAGLTKPFVPVFRLGLASRW